MTRYVLIAALLAAVTAVTLVSPATAAVPCEHGDVRCYEQCYLPRIEKGKPIYWNAC